MSQTVSPQGVTSETEPAVDLSCNTLPEVPQDLTAAELAELQDQAKQAEYRRQFQLQMDRRGCPGCGE